jgi:hypothetical protein
MNSLNDREPLGAELLDLTGVRILLVEDSWPVGVALKSLLRALGADVPRAPHPSPGLLDC